MPRKAKYILKIEKAIDTIKRKVTHNECYFKREEHTRYALVDPMLRALGWDISNPGQVRVEYRTSRGEEDKSRVDYALFVPNLKDPVVIVEAKSITKGDIAYAHTRTMHDLEEEDVEWTEWQKKAMHQLEGYCDRLRLDSSYAVLTNGDFWDIYDLSKPGSFKDKRWKYFPVANTDAAQLVEVFEKLHLRNVLKKFKDSES